MNGIVTIKFDKCGKQYDYIVPNHISLESIGKYVIIDSPYPNTTVTDYVIAEVVKKTAEHVMSRGVHATKPIIDTIDDTWYNKYKEISLSEKLNELWERYSVTEKQKIIQNWQGDIF